MEKMISKAFNKQQNKITNYSQAKHPQKHADFGLTNLKFKDKNTFSNENKLEQKQIFKFNQANETNELGSSKSKDLNELQEIENKLKFINKSSPNYNKNNLEAHFTKPRINHTKNHSKTHSKNHIKNQTSVNHHQEKNGNKKNQKLNLNENQILRNILGKVNCANKPLYEPLNEQQYLKYLHSDGRIRCLRELRLAIYRRGIMPSLRSTLWKHLLNVYPPHLTSEQRVRFIQHHSEEYQQLCYTWQTNFQHSKVQAIHNQVRKDVLRTDRSHPFYTCKVNLDLEANNDITSSVSTYSSILTQLEVKNEDQTKLNLSHNSMEMNNSSSLPNQNNNNNVGVYENRNVQALTNILTTYALNHKIGYWQGMSDLCSPILLAVQNESDTYICFVALMRRLNANFNGDQHMANKFDLLRKLVQHYDPELYEYLVKNQANDLLFCYRWLLLELKREFKLDSALYMLEVSWAAMPPIFYNNLTMYDTRFNPYELEVKKISIQENFADQSTKQEINSEDLSKSKESNKINSNDFIDYYNHQQVNSTENKIFYKNSSLSLFKNLSNSSSAIEQNHLQNNLKQLKNDMASAASDLSKQVTAGMSQVMHGVANVANEIYSNFNSNLNSDEFSKSLNSKSDYQKTCFKRLKVASSVEDHLLLKRERFQQNNNNHISISSLNEIRTFTLDHDFNNSNLRTCSLNSSNQSLFEYNTNLNCILNRTQKQLRQQQADQLQSETALHTKSSINSNSSSKLNKQLITKRHIRFLPKILSTDSNDNAIDSPDADDLNENYKFPHLIDKQHSVDSIDSVDSLDYSNDLKSISSLINGGSSLKNTPLKAQQVSSYLSCSNSTSKNISHGTLIKLKKNFNNQFQHTSSSTLSNINSYHLQQHSLPSSPLFKKKLDSFDKPKLFNLTNSTQNCHSLVEHKNLTYNSHSLLNNTTNSNQKNNLPILRNHYNSNVQFDSIDQTELFVHCNGEHAEQINSYNNWTPERGLLNCFNNSQSFDGLSNSGTYLPGNQILSSTVTSTNTIVNHSYTPNFCASSTNSHQNLARQLSDKLISDKMYANRQNSNEESQQQFKNSLNKKLLAHAQTIINTNDHKNKEQNLNSFTSSVELNTSQTNLAKNTTFISLSEQLAKLNLNDNHLLVKLSNNSNEKEEKSEGYCSGSVSDRNSNYEEQLFTGGESMINTFSSMSNSVCLSASSSSSTSSSCSHSSMKSSKSSSSSSSLSGSSSFVILSSNASFKAKLSNIEKSSYNYLPNPAELSTGNAFMLFICLTILLQHRDKLINDQLDANEMAIYFDSYVRKHDLHFVLNTARELFQSYLNKWHTYQMTENTQTNLRFSKLDDSSEQKTD